MNKLSDEVLNKYLDNDLSQAELKTIRDQLQSSEEDRKRLRALQLIHSSLKSIEGESISSNFTSTLMEKIVKKSKAKKEQRFFIFSISSVFIIIALGIIGYVISLILATPQSASDTVAGTKETVTVLENLIVPIKTFLSKLNISMIGSVFSLGLLISVYFILDLMKHSKGNLGRQH